MRLLNTGDKKFKFEWNMDAEALVNKDKPDTQAKFDDSISYDEGKMNDGLAPATSLIMSMSANIQALGSLLILTIIPMKVPTTA